MLPLLFLTKHGQKKDEKNLVLLSSEEKNEGGKYSPNKRTSRARKFLIKFDYCLFLNWLYTILVKGDKKQ
jgi:hypothetical protein